MMKVIRNSLFPCLCILLAFSVVGVASAQSYRGAYPSGSGQKKKKETSAPKIFSSQVTSVQQAEKLDMVYANLMVSLVNYASTDFTYQMKLYDLIAAERFQYTRYGKEFSPTLKEGMDNLNKNYNNMLTNIQDARAQYSLLLDTIRPVDHDTLNALWEKKMAEFEEVSKTHFELQGRFLKTYKSLVDFILKQGGGYYYKSSDNRVYFYKFGGYKYFGKSIDKLRRVSYDQKINLKDNAKTIISVDALQ